MTCKHDWHFIEGTDRLQCARCKAETGPRTYDQLTRDMFEDITMPTEQMQQYKLHDSRPNSIIFHCAVNDEQTAVLRISKDGIWANPDVPCDDAAKKVLEAVDVYVKVMVEKAVTAAVNEEIEACAAIAHEAEPYQAADLIMKRKRT
jgi:hypothetical protein